MALAEGAGDEGSATAGSVSIAHVSGRPAHGIRADTTTSVPCAAGPGCASEHDSEAGAGVRMLVRWPRLLEVHAHG